MIPRTTGVTRIFLGGWWGSDPDKPLGAQGVVIALVVPHPRLRTPHGSYLVAQPLVILSSGVKMTL